MAILDDFRFTKNAQTRFHWLKISGRVAISGFLAFHPPDLFPQKRILDKYK